MNIDTILALPINIRREESDGTLADEEQILNALKPLGVSESSFSMVSPDNTIRDTVLQSRFGIELWRYVLIAALMIALAEMMVGREPKQKI